MRPIIEIEHLNKSFGEIKAIQDLSFRVCEGELFAFLGVNGAGKSTTINILCGQLAQDSGSVVIDGCQVDKQAEAIKREIGVVYQNSVLDKPLTVRDNLKTRTALYAITGRAFEERLKELSKLLAFEDILKRTVGKLSGGQRRRVDIARALIHKPKILILDEPTTGLDPQTRKLLWQVISELRRTEKMTVFLTTHYMEEAADADNVVILDSGKLIAQGTPLELKNCYTGDFVTIYGAQEAQIRALNVPYEVLRDAIRISVPNTTAVTQMILANPKLFHDYEVTKGKMDDVFLAATGKQLTGGEKK